MVFFFFFKKQVSQFYSGKSSWNTFSKSSGSSSNHTSVSVAKTALLAREWANLLPSLRTCWKLHTHIQVFANLKPCLVTLFVFYFCFLVFKGKRKKQKFFLFSKWKTCLVSWKENHIFQKQHSKNLYGSCFWKSWILFCLVNFFNKKLYIF